MRTITRARALILAGALVGAVTLSAVAASGDTAKASRQNQSASTTRTTPVSTPPETRTETERGTILEGTGTWRGQKITVSVYENQRYGNALQIIIGDPDGKHAIGAGEGQHAYIVGGVLNVGLDVDGKLAVVKGTVTKNGAPRPATELNTDGDLVSSKGTHVPLLVEAAFTYRGETVTLEFTRALRYYLESERLAAN